MSREERRELKRLCAIARKRLDGAVKFAGMPKPGRDAHDETRIWRAMIGAEPTRAPGWVKL